MVDPLGIDALGGDELCDGNPADDDAVADCDPLVGDACMSCGGLI